MLAYTAFPTRHRAKLHSTNPLERLNKEIKRRADVVGIFPNEDSMEASTILPTLLSSGRWRSRASGCGRATGRALDGPR